LPGDFLLIDGAKAINKNLRNTNFLERNQKKTVVFGDKFLIIEEKKSVNIGITFT
jgi:hypothetical protein